MKSVLILLLILTGSVFIQNAFAISPAVAPIPTSISGLTVKEFIALDINSYQSQGNNKLSWVEKTALKSFQKNLSNKIRKGKLDPESVLKDVNEGSGTTRGLLSVVFSVAGLLFLFIPGWVGYLGIVLSAVGIYFGLKGMQKDEDTLLALIGTIVGALVLLLNVIIMI